MWLFTKVGYFSAVQDQKNPNTIQVRARLRKDLVALRKAVRKHEYGRQFSKIISTPHADYPYRMLVNRDDWNLVVWQLSSEINYTNFKANFTDRKRHNVYLDVWSATRDLEVSRHRGALTSNLPWWQHMPKAEFQKMTHRMIDAVETFAPAPKKRVRKSKHK